MSQEDFEQLAKDAGLPVTEAEVDAEFEALRVSEGLTITNTSAFGPFWRFVRASSTSAAKWLIDFIVATVLPQAFVKTAGGAMLELHAWAVNLTRKAAVAAVGDIAFTRATSSGDLVVPAGTVVQSTAIDGVTYSVQTISDATLLDGVATLDIACQALAAGAAYNLGADYYTTLPEPIDGVTVTNAADWLTTPGADTETDDELRARVRNQYSAINQWHTDAVYTSIIAGFAGVSVGNIYFEHDAPRGPGTANAFVLLETGNPDAPFIASIQSEITDNGNHGHGDDLQVFAMPESSHDLTCTVWFVDNVDPADKAALLLDVENIIRSAFRENTIYAVTKTQPWDVFSFSTLGAEIQELLPAVKNLVFSLGYINSAMDIPRLGIFSVAENA